jgi:hypothetical protein
LNDHNKSLKDFYNFINSLPQYIDTLSNDGIHFSDDITAMLDFWSCKGTKTRFLLEL